jgi:sigma-B regulation protein RsbU (phosphoserine phosphatase)
MLETVEQTAPFSGPPRPAPGITPAAGGRDPWTDALVLVAEDDPDSMDFIEHFLTRAGFRVRAARDGEEVFRCLAEEAPQLFLLDCNMPGLDGFEVCRRLKTDPAFSDVPVVFLTALTQPRDKKRGFEAGGVDYVTKPIEVVELLARIRNHLELAAGRQLLRHRADSLERVVEVDQQRFAEVRSGQASLLTQPSDFPELKLTVRYQPAHEAGGDFYEIARLSDDGDYGLLVTDVSGHDLSVPYITGGLKALAATFLKDALTPQETMLMLNSSLQSFLRPGYYVTGCYLKYARAVSEIELISAAHPAVLLQPADGECRYIELRGDVLGMVDQPTFESTRLAVRPGDRLFVYTDGLIESYRDGQNRCGRARYGMERLLGELAGSPARPVGAVVDGIVDRLLAECGGNAGDDIVVLGIEF